MTDYLFPKKETFDFSARGGRCQVNLQMTGRSVSPGGTHVLPFFDQLILSPLLCLFHSPFVFFFSSFFLAHFPSAVPIYVYLASARVPIAIILVLLNIISAISSLRSLGRSFTIYQVRVLRVVRVSACVLSVMPPCNYAMRWAYFFRSRFCVLTPCLPQGHKEEAADADDPR